MRVAVIGIVIEKDRAVAEEVNKLLSSYGEIIMGRMGIPDKINEIYVISIIVKGSQEQISALTGKLGRLKNVNVKSAVTAVEIS